MYFFFSLVSIAITLLFNVLEASDTLDNPIKQNFSRNRICLTMIVRNESSIIERCLNSVKDVVDCISICDTGSTDNTIEIIEKFMQKYGIPGKVHQHTWQNFGYNRTLSVQAAQKTLEDLGFSLPYTYLLLLDADMVLKVDSTFNRNVLKNDCYSVLHKSSIHSYYNTRLVQASLSWESIGLTHEYWSCKNSKQPIMQLHSLMIEDYGDGGCKADKFERDIKLLTQGLKDEPNNERYMFYCALSHKCLRQYDQAIRWYKNRIERGGWKEEIWYSKYMIGECYEEMGYWDHALHWYLEAYQYNRDRAEPLQKIATYYRLNGKNDLAYLFAKQGSQIPYPSNQILFISHPVYNYQFDEELSIVAYYTPFKEEGYEAANRLLLRKNVPQSVKETTYRNMLFYLSPLENACFQPIKIELPLLRAGGTEYYYPMNSSIQKTANGYKLICRTVNYSQKDGKEYKSRNDVDDTIRTKNFLIQYDFDFNVLSQHEIIEDLPRKRMPSKIQGLEDCRIVEINKQDWFICATYDTSLNCITQSLCKLGNQLPNHTIQVEKLIPLKGLHSKIYEKNWLPFTTDHRLYAIYSYDPFIIYQINTETGNCEIAVQHETSYNFSNFRGSAAPIPFDDGFLMVVHEVVFNESRFYYHRFLYLDKNFTIQKVSKPFIFLHKGIEYCCGMTIDHSGAKCILAIGIEDKEAQLCTVDLNTIRSLLKPLP